MLKIAVFRTFSPATERASAALEFGEREANLRVILHNFRIHHCVLTLMAENLIAIAFWGCLTHFFAQKTQNCAVNWVGSYW